MYELRVLEGAEWLDKVKPGWWSWIDLDRLDMFDGSLCIAGQAFTREAGRDGWISGYAYVCEMLANERGIAPYSVKRAHLPQQLGLCPGDVNEDGRTGLLADAWREFIIERRATAWTSEILNELIVK